MSNTVTLQFLRFSKYFWPPKNNSFVFKWKWRFQIQDLAWCLCILGSHSGGPRFRSPGRPGVHFTNTLCRHLNEASKMPKSSVRKTIKVGVLMLILYWSQYNSANIHLFNHLTACNITIFYLHLKHHSDNIEIHLSYIK